MDIFSLLWDRKRLLCPLGLEHGGWFSFPSHRIIPPSTSSIISATVALCIFLHCCNSVSALDHTTPKEVWSQGTKLSHAVTLQGSLFEPEDRNPSLA